MTRNDKIAILNLADEGKMRATYKLSKDEFTASTFAGAQISMRLAMPQSAYRYWIVCALHEVPLLQACMSLRGTYEDRHVGQFGSDVEDRSGAWCNPDGEAGVVFRCEVQGE